ncbi:hypothetical protein Aph02nite_25770 [Actinoplanes philippinensis]|uniref:Uncharacterized conserved protein, DUF849 family n=1 Tax=Actinoplanes philippinensis TaxID=35752 RepID=A0A1I2G515_9ACTN|nr:3-keto-5-aminohexanoate cleavage protein [Actinoplanes philippinensis]GIE76627.1 hypothetical protein Aph02nite_25770 [Actinoplanes philippinensis]SFF12735.1 Uncharacterized conserved protein, DUF849 family [Actinoplanes philippinensis]
MRSRIERLKACLNGGRRSDEHPAVPITAGELAAEAVAAVAAGAEALHVHPRDRAGAESLAAVEVAAAVGAVRRACRGVPVGVTTGLWIAGGDPGRRLAAVAAWAGLPATARPDFASVNVGEPGFAALAEVLQGVGVEVEAGVWSVADARALAAAGLPGGAATPTGRPAWARVLVEVIGAPAGAAVAVADAILAELDALGVAGPRLLHGEDAGCWPLVAHAARRGLPTRIGLEDTLTGPRGEPVTGNADLVRHALTVRAAG